MLQVRLLGALEVELDGTAIDSPASQRPWAVFAYLALASRPVTRSELAAQFWPDVLDASARGSLRSALWALRRQLGDRLVVDRDHAQLRPGEDLWVDVREFERLGGEGREREALELCRGELLDGVEDEWALTARARHRERVIAVLEQLALGCEARGERSAAVEWTRQQIERDPFDEAAHRRLIARLDAAGDRTGAIRTYRALADRLRRELGVAPSSATRELAERVRAETPAVTLDRPPVAAPGMLPLVGRERELAELHAAWRTVGAGSGAVTLMTGDAGIGKTRLATELRSLAVADGGLAVVCGALDLGGTAPLSLWAELIRELLPALPAPPADAAWPEDLALITSELPPHFARAGAPARPVAPDLQRTRLFEAAVALLAWAARDTGLLLVLEDVHSADRPSLELAGYAARRVARQRVMMLLTRRELPHSPDADQLEYALRTRGLLACELTLGPLPTARVAALARRVAHLSDADVERVVKSAEGNPLLAVETARAVERGDDGVSPTLRGAVRATLSRLQGEARQLIELVAVAARGLDAVELAQLSLDDLDESATQALETGLVLLSADGRFGFRHALLRDAVSAEVPQPRRRGLHRRWAEALLASEQAGGVRRPAEAARQLRLAGCDAEAAPQLARAAADARALGALEQAAAYLEEAIGIAARSPETWLELGEVESWRGRRERAEVAFDHALALLADGEPLDLARAWLRRGRAYHGLICHPPGVLKCSRKALELLDQSPVPSSAERQEALAALAWAEAVAGSVDEAERLVEELDATAGTEDSSIYDVGHAHALALMRRGRFVESFAPAIAAGEAIGRAGRPDLAYGCWINAAGAAAAAGQFERALEFVDRGFSAVAGQGMRSLELELFAARCFLLTRLDRLDEARAAAEAEQRLAEELAQPAFAAMASHDSGLVALAAGEYELAARLLGEALVDGAPISRPLTRLAIAEACARIGQPDRAEAELRATVLEPVRASDFPAALVARLTRLQGLIALARDDRELAGKRLAESVAGWERLSVRARGFDNMAAVLADLGRPVVGLVEPERELERARRDLESISVTPYKGATNAVVP